MLELKNEYQSTQTKDSLKKLAIIVFFENFYKEKIYIKSNNISFSMCCKKNISNM